MGKQLFARNGVPVPEGRVADEVDEAVAAADELGRRGLPATLVAWGDLRETVWPVGQASPQEEEILHRALVAAAKLLVEAGGRVIIDATAPRRHWRELARRLIPRFAEVQLRCPLPLCLERERRGRWTGTAPGRAPAPAGPDMVFDYEPALAPELTLYTDVRGIGACVEDVVRLAEGGDPELSYVLIVNLR